MNCKPEYEKKGTLFFLLVSVLVVLSWQNHAPVKVLDQFKIYLINEISSVQEELSKGLADNNATALKQIYHRSRKHYKRIEFFVEYCSPREAKYFINGALVPKHDEENGSVVVLPQGFQRIEALVYDEHLDTIELHRELNLLLQQFRNLQEYYSGINIDDNLLLEMCQLQLFRIAALNLNGYDATISQTNVQEAQWSLEGLEKVVVLHASADSHLTSLGKNMRQKFKAASTFLLKNQDYNTFNRLEFITIHINELNKAFVHFHNASALPWSTRRQALNLREAFLFGVESFNPQYFSIYYEDTLHLEEQAALGRKLFYDPLLSGNNSRSCASCHNASLGFSDGAAKGLAMDGKTLARNTPTLYNVAFQKAFFHDGRAYQLEQQISDVLSNPLEMRSSLEEAIKKLKANSEYKILFANAFVGAQDAAITEYAVQKAITEYEKTLVSFNSRFDQYLRGDKTKLNDREINGYNVFSGKALCGSCHFLPLFNGTVPPSFNDSEFEVLGTPEHADNRNLDPDIGRYAVTKVKEQKHAFKTPTVRNAEFTAPYMHNGVYNNLSQVIEFYVKGGGAGLGFSVPNQTLPFDSLKLSKNEKEDLILFIRSLADTTSVY